MNWSPVVGFEGYYEVSDTGLVRSVDRWVPHGDRLKKLTGKLMKQRIIRNGRRETSSMVWLARRGGNYGRLVHRLVAEAFIGPPPEGTECCHNDGDATNNHVSNLRWDTHSANVQDMVMHGTAAWLTRTHCPHGHEYSPENTRHTPEKRICKTCRAEVQRKYRKSKEAV